MSTLDLQRAPTSAGEMAYADEGDGPAVVLLHGFPTSSHLWRDLLPILSVRFRVIAPDLIGHGASDKPADAPLDIGAQAGYVAELLDHLRVEGLAAVGHDIGGAVAQLLALDRAAASLVLVDPVTADAEPSTALRRLQAAEDHHATGEFSERTIRAAFDLGMRHRDRLSPPDLEAFTAPWRDDPQALLRAARALTATGLEGREADLAELDIPAFIVWGEEDVFLPASQAEPLWELLPEASLVLLPGCGHFVTEDAGDTVIPLIAQFLRSRYLGEAGHDHPQGPTPVDLGVSFRRPVEDPQRLVDE